MRWEGGGGSARHWPPRMRQPSLFSFSLGDASPGGFRTCAPGRRPGRAGTRTHRCAPASAGLFSRPRSQFSTWPAGRRQGGAVPAALPRLLFFTFFLQLLVQVVDVHRLAGRDVAHGGQAWRAAWRAAERLTPAEKKKTRGRAALTRTRVRARPVVCGVQGEGKGWCALLWWCVCASAQVDGARGPAEKRQSERACSPLAAHFWEARAHVLPP